MFCCDFPLNFLSQEDDRKLLREIGTNGDGRPDEVQQLIDEVLSLCCCFYNPLFAFFHRLCLIIRISIYICLTLALNYFIVVTIAV